MTEKYYKLTKLSKTGYEVVTSDIDMIYDMLDRFVCNSCKVKQCEVEKYCDENDIEEFERDDFIEDAFPDDYDTLPTIEKVDWLMSTDCGCEFMFEEFDSYYDYMDSMKEDVDHYLKTKEK